MRILLAIVLVAFAGWSGFWFWNAQMRDRVLTNWLEERRAAGWVAEGDVRVIGFPNRVDAVVTGLELADPRAGWSWKAPEFRILSLTYQPHHMILAFPGQQTVATPFDTARIEAEKFVGSIVFEPNTRLALDHSTIEMDQLHIEGETGWKAAIGKALFSTRQSADTTTPFAYDVDFGAKDLSLPGTWIAQIDQAGLLGDRINSAHLDATLVFDRAWDRAAIEGENPTLLEIRVRDVAFLWGKLDLQGKGRLRVDERGYAEGKLDVTARNWFEMLDAAERSGLLNSGVAGTLRGALKLYARLSGQGDSVALPLEFKDGMARLGPVTVGPAPLLLRR